MYLPIARNKRNTFIAVTVFMLMWLVFSTIIVGFISMSSTATYPKIGTRTDYSHPTYSYAFDMQTFAIGIAIAVAIIALYAFFSYRSAAKTMLRQTGAIEVNAETNAVSYKAVVENYPYLLGTIENLSQVAGIPMPKVYIINDAAPNAFATGTKPENAAVSVTTGLLAIMEQNEVEAVLAHEISHIKNYDVRLNTVVFGLTVLMGLIVTIAFRMSLATRGDRNKDAGAIIALVLVVGVVLKLFMNLVSLAVSRQREYLADATGAELMHNTDALANALNKLRQNNREVSKYNVAGAHLFFADPDTGDTPAKIGKPGMRAKFHNLFNTHPPLEMRIARLKGFGDIDQGMIKANA